MSTTTPPIDGYIVWTVAHTTNTLRFEHVGCVVGDGTWTTSLDDLPLPLTEQREHCACCGHEQRLQRGNGSAEAFRLDRALLRNHLVAEGDTDEDDDARPAGISSDCHSGGFPGAIASYFSSAIDARAITGIADVEIVVYDCAHAAIIITVREEKPQHLVPWTALRQVASMSIEAKDIAEDGNESFDEGCAALTEILRIASGLVPALRAVQLLAAEHEALARALRCEQAPEDASLANLVVAAGGALLRNQSS